MPEVARRRARPAASGRRWLALAAKAAVSLVLLWLLARSLRLEELTAAFAGVRPGHVGAAILLLLVVVVLGAVRWRLIAARLGVPLPVATLTRLSFEGLFFSQALPSTVGGDAVRAYRATRLGLPVRPVVHAVMLDRIIGLIGLIGLVAAGLPVLAARVPELPGAGVLAVLLLAGLGGCALLLGVVAAPERLRQLRLVAMIAALSEAAWGVLRAPATAAGALLLSFLIHALTVVSVAVLAAGLGAPIGVIDCFLIVPAALLAAAAPISIAGWGVREGAMMGGFILLGLGDGADALALSVLFGLALIVTSLPGGGLWLAVGAPPPDAAGEARGGPTGATLAR